jgi:Cellulase (glycosyl hydrolase family 5)
VKKRVLQTRVAAVAAGLLAMVTVAACGPGALPAAAPRPAVPAAKVGFSTDGLFEWQSPAQIKSDLAQIRNTGARWVRLQFDWSKLEPYGPGLRAPGQGTWWAHTDALVDAARAQGLQVLGTIDYTPKWAAAQGCNFSDHSGMFCAPRSAADFGAFAARVAAHYAPKGVHTWEIWNEPNSPYFFQPVNAATYVGLLKAAYPAVHAADPHAFVVTGGMSPHGDLGRTPDDPLSPINFTKAMYAAGAKGFFDALGHHPYPPMPHEPMSGTIGWNALMQTTWLHQIMADNGDGAKQIWGTEFGAATGSSSMGVSEAAQARYISDELVQWNLWPYTGPLFVYELRDSANDPSDWGSNLGLTRADGTAKPALSTLTSMIVP